MSRKIIAFAIGAAVTALTGSAWAQEPEPVHPSLQQITVHDAAMPYATRDRPFGDCTPPSLLPDLPACRALALDLRDHFDAAEIQMIFGAWSSSPRYLTSYGNIMERYRDFVASYYHPVVLDELPVAQATR